MLKNLSVVEIPYYDPFKWVVDLKDPSYPISSPCEEFKKPREIEDLELCGVYHKAGVPYTRERLSYLSEDHPNEEGYLGFTRLLSDRCLAALRAENGLFVTGGFCTYAPGIVGGIQRAIGEDKKIGIVWIDEHADIAAPDRTNTDLLAGMPLSTIIGVCLDDWRVSCGLKKPCEGRHVLISDYREGCKEEDEIIAENQVNTLDAAQFKDEAAWRTAVEKLAEEVDAIYLQVDADIMSKEFVPAYDYPVPGGHDVNTVMRNAGIVMDTGKVIAFATTCFYFDTDAPGRETTTLSAMRVASASLSRWKQSPVSRLIRRESEE